MSEKITGETEEKVVSDNGVTSSENVDNDWNHVNKLEPKLPIDNKRPYDTDELGDYNLFGELSKRFVLQQDQTTEHRSTLMKWFAWVTGTQLFIIDILIISTVTNWAYMPILFDFLKYFIGATFVELLGGLLIIVKFVFSHETYDMLKHLTYVDPKSK